MTGNQLVSLIRKHKGKLYVPVHAKDGTIHVAVEKSDLIDIFSGYGSNETDYEMYQMDNGTWTVGATS